jgi:hypothetical protein
MPATPFFKFVSATGKGIVSRYGTGSNQREALIIGGRREPLPERGASEILNILEPGAGRLTINTELVEAFTEAEWDRYHVEYSRALRDGALRERTEADYLAQNEPTATAPKATASPATASRSPRP